MALVGCNYGVHTSVFLFGCEISSKCGKYKFHPKKRIFCYNILSVFSGKNVKFWKKKKVDFLGATFGLWFLLGSNLKTIF